MANFYKKSHQLGRSMIEMLGVLAIIGVLSVAGIAGYTKAMDQYTWNKALDQWNVLIGLMYQHKSQLMINDRSVATSQTNLLPILYAFNDLPNEMKRPGGRSLRDAMGTVISVYSHGTGYIGILAGGAEENNAACRLMLTIGQYHHATIDALQIYNNAGGMSLFYGDNKCCKNCKNCLKDILISQIATACKNNPVCTNSNECDYLIIWR